MRFIDLEMAIQYSYSKEIFLKLANNFTNDYKTFPLDLLDLSRNDVLIKVHKLKGITLYLGAKKLYNECLLIEDSRNFDEDLKKLIYIFNQSFKELLYF